MKIELLYFNGCPEAARARALLVRCMSLVGLRGRFIEHQGDFPSPSIHINGVDVMGLTLAHGRCCRLDLPTETRILDALRVAKAAD